MHGPTRWRVKVKKVSIKMTEELKTEEVKAKTVVDDMDSRRLFDDADSATSYIEKCQADFADFGGYPVAAVGLTSDGEFDPEVYTDDMQIAVSVLTKRGEGKESTTVHAIVIYPAPKIDAILASEQGRDWLTGIMQKELNHVAVRQLRKAETASDIADATESMPTTVADYVTSGRESTSGILESFNTLWQIIKKGIGAKSKPFALANLSKKELRKAMESASYAATVYPQLETRQNKKGEPESLFVMAATFGQLLAKAESLDTTIFDRMLSQRNEKDIDVAGDEEEFDLEAMAASLVKKSDESTEAKSDAEPDAAEGEESQDDAPDAEGEGETAEEQPTE